MTSSGKPNTSEQWTPFEFFLGEWSGKASGRAGTGTVERTYSLTLQDQFIEMRSRAVFPPQEANPSGETHEDLGLISYDKTRSLYVMREFHVEGYVNQYTLEPPTDASQPLVFMTESIENIPAGWRARTTLEQTSEDGFRETFDLARPDQEWACYITIDFSRTSGG